MSFVMVWTLGDIIGVILLAVFLIAWVLFMINRKIKEVFKR